MAIFLFFFSLTINTSAALITSKQEEHPPEKKKHPERTAYVLAGSFMHAYDLITDKTLLHFGTGHLLQKKWLKGSFFLGAETGLFFLKKNFRDKIGLLDYDQYPNISNDLFFYKREGLSPNADKYENYYNLTGHSLFYMNMIDFFSAYRSQSPKSRKIPLDNSSIPNLMLSPLQPHYLKSPWVLLPVLVAGVGGFLAASNGNSISDARQLTMFGKQYSPAQATLLTAGVEAYRYALVAAGEEMVYRGVIQSELSEHMHPTLANVLASAFFGAMHIPNNGTNDGIVAALTGLYLGYRYQSHYDLGEVICIHFWLDWLPTMIEFIRNPQKGRYVFGIQWKF